MMPRNLLLMAVSLALILVLLGCVSKEQKFAKALTDPQQCNNQSFAGDRLECFEYVSTTQNKPEYCEYYTGKKVDCYTRVASKMGKPEVCDRLTDPTEVYTCKGMVGSEMAVDFISDFMGEKDPQCLDGCLEKLNECTARYDRVYADDLKRCAAIEAIGANPDVAPQAGPCEDQARQHWNTGKDGCEAERKTCDGKC